MPTTGFMLIYTPELNHPVTCSTGASGGSAGTASNWNLVYRKIGCSSHANTGVIGLLLPLHVTSSNGHTIKRCREIILHAIVKQEVIKAN